MIAAQTTDARFYPVFQTQTSHGEQIYCQHIYLDAVQLNILQVYTLYFAACAFKGVSSLKNVYLLTFKLL